MSFLIPTTVLYFYDSLLQFFTSFFYVYILVPLFFPRALLRAFYSLSILTGC